VMREHGIRIKSCFGIRATIDFNTFSKRNAPSGP
jgi:hypothetical protein